MKKGQIVTFDFTSSVIIFIVFCAVVIWLVFMMPRGEQKVPFETEYVFDNLEKNLKENPDEAFFADYRIDSQKLSIFIANHGGGTESIDEYAVGIVGEQEGIGVDPSLYDVCLYLIDQGAVWDVGLTKALGRVEGYSCSQLIEDGFNPCDDYKRSISMFKPVLLDMHDPDESKIVQMNILLCEK